jgi:hypothetical protein
MGLALSSLTRQPVALPIEDPDEDILGRLREALGGPA